MAEIRVVLFCLCLFAVVGPPLVDCYSIIIDSYLRSNNVHDMAEHNPKPLEDFQRKRDAFIAEEFNRGTGSSLVLNEKETLLNEYVMKLKETEINHGVLDPKKFIPAQHFFEVMDKINESDLFKILMQMPKGGVLHAHDTALCNLDFIVQLTYWDNLWQMTDPESKRPRFRFSRKKPVTSDGSKWSLVKKERERRGQESYDAELRKNISLYNKNPTTEALDVNAMWAQFMEIFAMTDGILLYKDAWEAYYLQALKEFSADEVDYLEIRSTLPKLYDLDNNEYDEMDVVQIYYDVTNQYQKTNPKFMGAKIIYAPLRIANDSHFLHYMDVCRRLHAKYPGFVAGFDLVGQEDPGRPLIDFADQILTLPSDLKLFFHAGETNWNGVTDDNMIDAILLGTQRIGHGYALIKHPSALEFIKRQGIAVEVNPISNQVLRLVADTRNHPAAVLFSDDYPVVISSDDPSFWEAKPLSHDFFVAFLGIANSRQDLRFLKQLAINSIKYSAMSEPEKDAAMDKWHVAWDRFVDLATSKLGNGV